MKDEIKAKMRTFIEMRTRYKTNFLEIFRYE